MAQQQDNNNQQDNSNSLQGNNNTVTNGAFFGLNLDNVNLQIKDGQLTYALNATVEGFDGNQMTYQNEESNFKCIDYPVGYKVIGNILLKEQDIVVFFLYNETTLESEIGQLNIINCTYNTIINSSCLNFSMLHPVNAVYRVTDCTTQIFFTDNYNPRRYLDLNNLPYTKILGSDGCTTTVNTSVIDCSQMLVQKVFTIPLLTVNEVSDGGVLVEGTYQFAIQYSDELGNAFSDYFSVTNPSSIFGNVLSPNYNLQTNKAIKLDISNLDTEFYNYNLAVIKTINGIPSVSLVGTFYIKGSTDSYIYTGSNSTEQSLLIDDILLKRGVYPYAKEVTTIDDTLIWANLTSEEEISYQSIANNIQVQWETYKAPDNVYSKGESTSNIRGYMRDEVYALEVCFLLKSGKQTNGFHIPGRHSVSLDLQFVKNNDVVYTNNDECDTINHDGLPNWKVYNTASVIDYTPEYKNYLASNLNSNCYQGSYQYGNMSYYESTDTYPCNSIYGSLSGEPIRHHKFPDCLVSPIHDQFNNIYPIGFRINNIHDIVQSSNLTQEQKDNIIGFKILRANRVNNKSIIAKGLLYNSGKYTKDGSTYYFPNYPYNDLNIDPFITGTIYDNDARQRFTFHSPDTSFYQPFLGNILKLETIEEGLSTSHFVQVKNHSKYKIFTDSLFLTSLGAAGVIAAISRWAVAGVADGGTIIDGSALISTYEIFVNIFQNLVPFVNYAYQFNSIGNYNTSVNVYNSGNKQRLIDISSYLVPGITSVGDVNYINNHQRESSVYIKTNSILPYTHEQGGIVDKSRWTLGCNNISTKQDTPISSYYGSIKRNLDNQYGLLYSYETIDTGFQFDISTNIATVFGGDVFINRFGLKRKLPFFTDNRVGAVDGSDIEFNNLHNIGTVNYWYSSETNATAGTGFLTRLAGTLFGTKTHNLDCDSSSFFYRTGRMYLFAYGIPYFYTESEVNIDFRQAADAGVRDFYPKNNQLVIPDEWLQEINNSIQNDNWYLYNKTYSKQNKENFFTHLRQDYNPNDTCYTYYPTRLIYSDRINNTKRSNWLFSKPANLFDLPNTYGKITGIHGLENNQLLVRFDNKAQIYNAMVSIDTNNGKGAYVGGNELFRNIPLDFFDTDQGYSGSGNRLLLKSELGHLFVDQKRGNIFLLIVGGTYTSRIQLKEITNGMSKWFTANLPFFINQYFPNIDIDNAYNGIGITGVWDGKYEKFIITKLDYEPIVNGIIYNQVDGKFYLNGIRVHLEDTNYFCNKSFTLSYSPRTDSWISFHSYMPNFYIPQLNYFHTGINNKLQSNLWVHNSSPTNYQTFYGILQPYVLEYPIKFGQQDEILSSIKDYTTILEYKNDQDFYEIDYGIYFNKAIIYNNQQCSGLLNLIPKPLNSLSSYLQYPKFNSDSKDILVTKSDNVFNYNTFWDIKQDNIDNTFFKKSCKNRSIDKELDSSILNYSQMSHNKSKIRAKNLRIRHIQDATNKYKFISKFIDVNTQKSIK